MARILFCVPPLTGHLNPALAVASVLKSRGHEIAWAVHARQIADKLPPRSCVYPLDAQDPDGLDIADPQVRGLESVRLFFEDYTMPMAQRMLKPLEASARHFCPDIMVVDHQLPGAALVARKLGLPWASFVTTTASILKMSPTVDEWVAMQYRRLQKDYLPAELVVERPDFSPHQVIVFSTETLVGDAHPREDAPYHFVGPTKGGGRRAVDFPWEWLRGGTKKIFISLGTVSRDRDTRFFEVMMAALSEMPDVQAVMVAPESLAEQAPDNVLVREYVPQLELLGWMDGVISHAGHNTVCETLSRGLPLIVAPIRDDQPVIARQVIDAGAGLFMRHGKVSPAVASKLINELLTTPSLAENAQRLGRDLRAAPGAEGAADLLTSLADIPYQTAEVALRSA